MGLMFALLQLPTFSIIILCHSKQNFSKEGAFEWEVFTVLKQEFLPGTKEIEKFYR